MKMLYRLSVLLAAATALNLSAQTTFTLNPLVSFGTGASGTNTSGSIQPGESLGTSPINGNSVIVSALTVAGVNSSYGVQPGDAPPSTNGFNMRGLSFDPITGNLIFVDTHGGNGGSLGAIMPTNSAIYILDPNTGQIIGALATNGIVGGGGVGAVVVAGVADDGVVYVANQVNLSTSSGFKLYRWPSANVTNDNYFTNSGFGRISSSAPTVAFTNTLSPTDRIGQTMDVRGAGTNTQIIIGTSALTGGTTGTNVYLFTTADGTNFNAHRLSIPGLTSVILNDGIAFGVGNTFWAKQVGQPLTFFSFETDTFTGTIIASYKTASTTDPLLNLSAISVDNANHLLAGLEEIGGTATGGRGKVWLFDISNPTNAPPAVLASRIYLPNFQKATAPMGYLKFGNGRLWANVVNNGLMANTVDTTPLGPPSFVQDLPATTRVLATSNALFQVQAITDVTNYQWYSNNVPIPGANTYYLTVPNVTTNMSGIVFKVTVMNAAGSATSANSTLTVLDPSGFFHLDTLWSKIAGTDPTNVITSNGGGGTPNERCIAYNALSNQLLVTRASAPFPTTRIFVLNADNGAFLYTLKTNGIIGSPTANIAGLNGIGVADDGAVYACSVSSATVGDQTFKIYRWADSGSNTLPVQIFGTNSSAASGNPVADLVGGTTFRFGDNLAVHGSGTGTEIVVDSQNDTRFAAVLNPTDSTMTNWVSHGWLLQNAQGSYGFQAYGNTIGRSLQFGNNDNTFWQKRYNAAAGAPLAQMAYSPGGNGLSLLQLANSGLPLFTNGPSAINFALKVAAGVNFVSPINADSLTAYDYLYYYDLTDPSQAVQLFQAQLPGGATGGFHKANNNAVAQVVFGVNSITGTNYIFVINGNNGVSAFVLSGGAIPPPQILAQPKSLRILEGTTASMYVTVDQTSTIAWYKGTNSPVDTGVRGPTFTISGATGSSGGDYFVIANNVNGSATSQVAHVSVGLTNDNYTISQTWAVGAANSGNLSYPYITKDGGANTPNERSFAYNALSNQLIIVRCPPASTAYTNWVVDAATGNLLYTMNMSGIIHMGASEVSGSNPIDLVGSACADDGALYVASESPNASGGSGGDPLKMMHIYRWADTGPNTTPTLIYEGDPSAQQAGNNLRWGDVITARGSGTNTELFMNPLEGTYGAVLHPTNSSMLGFTNFFFPDNAGGGSIGRSVQFGPTNTVFEKRKGAALYLSGYVLSNQTDSVIQTVDSSTTLGGVAVDTLHNLAMGVDFIGSATKPDAVALYDISVPSAPMLIADYSFPSNQVANANVICQTIVASNYVYSLDANNGLIKFVINPPVNSMILHLANSPPNINLSWGNQFAILQGATTLSPPNWTDLTTPPMTNSVQSAAGANKFYRLIQRR
jgi:hypothetical protein